jgi:signal transduction histidine kinase
LIQDDGIGFDQVQALDEKKHLGLISMRERAENIGGTFMIEATPGQGSRLVWEFSQEKLERIVDENE